MEWAFFFFQTLTEGTEGGRKQEGWRKEEKGIRKRKKGKGKKEKKRENQTYSALFLRDAVTGGCVYLRVPPETQPYAPLTHSHISGLETFVSGLPGNIDYSTYHVIPATLIRGTSIPCFLQINENSDPVGTKRGLWVLQTERTPNGSPRVEAQPRGGKQLTMPMHLSSPGRL